MPMPPLLLSLTPGPMKRQLTDNDARTTGVTHSAAHECQAPDECAPTDGNGNGGRQSDGPPGTTSETTTRMTAGANVHRREHPLSQANDYRLTPAQVSDCWPKHRPRPTDCLRERPRCPRRMTAERPRPPPTIAATNDRTVARCRCANHDGWAPPASERQRQRCDEQIPLVRRTV